MWSELKTQEIGHERVNQLEKGYWKQMLEDGSTILTFGDTFESAWDVIKEAMKNT